MNTTRSSAKSTIGKLVHFFEQNIHQFKSPSFNETQARQQLIDPFFESLGWDITNRGMKPLYLQEVIPEGRVKTNIGKEVREQTVMFDPKQTLGKEYKEYASILDYIAEDEYKASVKEATKKPDYRFRIKGQTRFFVEAKKPFVDLSKNQDAIFQVKRYGFSGRVPVSILTDFEQFRVFDCTHKPLYEKPKLGIVKEFDLTYVQYLDEFDHLYDTFSREAVESGSLDTLTKKLLQKKTGDFALDKTFLDDLSKWREELARDIAKHPRNRRQLNDYTLNESVQRILDRIVFFRVCEDREIEVENTLLAVLQMWKSRPGISLYSLLNDLFKLRRTLYNGLLFSPHECEELEVGDDVLLKILQNLNYPFSPYHFNEIGVEILGSIYEKFLGKTIHLAKKNVIVSEKPEVRKAGGVYYTPQYIVNYIVDNTLGKLLYSTPSVPTASELLRPSGGENNPSPNRGGTKGEVMLLSPRQVAKLKIIDIACGSGSFLLGAFQKLIDYHTEWYTQHPKDIQTVNNVPDAYNDVNGNLRLSSRKKRDILVNNVYGVDIDRQAVEVTQMSLYLKVLENENADTLNPQMTLALKEVYLPALTNNIKCGNSLIGTDFGAQGEMFDDDIRRKVNPLDWEIEFGEIIKNGGFDCVIGNPPWAFTKYVNWGEESKNYLQSKFIADRSQLGKSRARQSGKINLFAMFLLQSINVLKKGYSLGYILPNNILRTTVYDSVREKMLQDTRLKTIVDLKSDVFEGVTASTVIIIIEKGIPTEEHKIQIIDNQSSDSIDPVILNYVDQKNCLENPSFVIDIFGDSSLKSITNKMDKTSIKMGELVDVFNGIATFKNMDGVLNKRKNKFSKPILFGKDISRYSYSFSGKFINYQKDKLLRSRDENIFLSKEKLVMQRIGGILVTTYDDKQFYTFNSVNNLLVKQGVEYKIQFFLGLLNSKLFCFYYVSKFTNRSSLTVNISKTFLDFLPICAIDFSNPLERKHHDELVDLADKMLELHEQLNAAKFDSEKEPIERQIKATDKKIDQLVYQLYGLTEEEIKVVEGDGK